MRWLFVILLLSACSTVETRRAQMPKLEIYTVVGLSKLQGCFANQTSNQNVQYLPRENGGTFSMGAGPQRYVFWTVDIDDLGTQRRVRGYAINNITFAKQLRPALSACL